MPLNIEEILHHGDFVLPVKRDSSMRYRELIEKNITNYLTAVKSNKNLFDCVDYLILEYDRFLPTVENLGTKLLEVIEMCFDARKKPHAYETFAKVMDEHAHILIHKYPSSNYYLDRKQIHYRTRKFDETTPAKKKKEELFHVRFEDHEYTSPSRFSGSGFPSLYMTNGLIVGYKEIDAETLNNFYAAKIQTKYTLNLLNLECSNPDIELKFTNRKEYDTLLQIKAIIYPLLCACFCEKHTKDSKSPPEYIISQFLLSWVQERNYFDGIKYSSTKINNSNFRKVFYNLVIPVDKIEMTGFCTMLKNKLVMSETCSGALDKTSYETYCSTKFASLASPINKDISHIEWEAKQVEYEFTEIGKMEFYITDYIPSEIIDF